MDIPVFPNSADTSYRNDYAPSFVTRGRAGRHVYRVFDQGPDSARWEDPADEGATRYSVIVAPWDGEDLEEALDLLMSSAAVDGIDTNLAINVERYIRRHG